MLVIVVDRLVVRTVLLLPERLGVKRTGRSCDAGENRQGEKGRKDCLHGHLLSVEVSIRWGAIMVKPKRAALYVRVSTDAQTVENQISELREVAEHRGWQIVEIYRDTGISGAKGRDQRRGLDAMLKDAGRRRFDVVMAWPLTASAAPSSIS